MKRRDDQATIDQQFLDPNSLVTPDGRHILVNEDWVAQKRLVWERGHHRCENWVISYPDIRISLSCKIRCPNDMEDVHHKIKRSQCRDDRIENLEGLCRKCHILKHPEKQLRFGSRSAEHSSKR